MEPLQKSSQEVVKSAVEFYNKSFDLMNRSKNSEIKNALVEYDALMQSYGMRGFPTLIIDTIQEDSYFLERFMFDEDSIHYTIQEIDSSIDEDEAIELSEKVLSNVNPNIKWW